VDVGRRLGLSAADDCREFREDVVGQWLRPVLSNNSPRFSKGFRGELLTARTLPLRTHAPVHELRLARIAHVSVGVI
jgi:hypothetical protein